MSMDNKQNPRTEEFSINGEELLAKLRELVHEGNVRRLIIRGQDGKTLIEVPLAAGGAVAAVAVILAPVWAALGALAALAAKLTVVVERVDDPAKPGDATPSDATPSDNGVSDGESTKDLSRPES
jgi:hypothetical protein